MMGPFSLEGKKILVTGSSSGIGRGIAVECSKMGAQLILNGRDVNRLDETLKMLEGDGHQIIEADISKQEEIERLVAEVLSISSVMTLRIYLMSMLLLL